MTRTPKKSSLRLGDLVAAAFDRTEVVSPDRRQAANLASRTVARWLARMNRPDIARELVFFDKTLAPSHR